MEGGDSKEEEEGGEKRRRLRAKTKPGKLITRSTAAFAELI